MNSSLLRHWEKDPAVPYPGCPCGTCVPGGTLGTSIRHLLEKQEGGSHYNGRAIQPIEYIQANNLGFCEGNVVKYVTRHREKGGAEDLRKAIQYLEFELSHTYGERRDR